MGQTRDGLSTTSGLDIAEIAADVQRKTHVEYRHPLAEPYGVSSRTTRSQKLAWDFLMARPDSAPMIAMVGAKGSSKTHFGAAFAFHMGQTYPNSMGCVISNTYTQAKDNAGKIFMKVSRILGYNAAFRSTITVDGEPFTQLFVVDLDGKGYYEGNNFYMLVRSFEAVKKLEGIEFDWMWMEEIQDAPKDAVVTAKSRIRGTVGNQAMFIAAMPHDEFHWMYKWLPQIGCMEENKVRAELGVPAFESSRYGLEDTVPMEDYDYSKMDTRGLFFEPTIFENKHNLPENYIRDLFSSLDETQAMRWIHAKRTSNTGNKVAYSYIDAEHRVGRMSHLLAHYDENLPITLTIDFNTSPMCAVISQVKRWSDRWHDDDIVFDPDGSIWLLDPLGQERHPIDDISNIAIPDRDVWVQVGELEVWEGGTRGLMDAFLKEYGSHLLDVKIIGDATGNRDDTRSGTTDWRIIEEMIAASNLADRTSVQKGLIANYNYTTGETKYSNPPRRDTINVLNAALKDAKGRYSMCFLQSSELPSDGAAASVSMMEKKPDGKVDDTVDKREGRDVKRTHFFDCVRYAIWDFKGGMERDLDTYQETTATIQENTTVGKSIFGGGSADGGVFGV